MKGEREVEGENPFIRVSMNGLISSCIVGGAAGEGCGRGGGGRAEGGAGARAHGEWGEGRGGERRGGGNN